MRALRVRGRMSGARASTKASAHLQDVLSAGIFERRAPGAEREERLVLLLGVVRDPGGHLLQRRLDLHLRARLKQVGGRDALVLVKVKEREGLAG